MNPHYSWYGCGLVFRVSGRYEPRVYLRPPPGATVLLTDMGLKSDASTLQKRLESPAAGRVVA